jgi:hypothetical protein
VLAQVARYVKAEEWVKVWVDYRLIKAGFETAVSENFSSLRSLHKVK